MLEIEVRTDIAAPAERVWALIGDPTRMGEWSPECEKVSWLASSTRPAVGAVFRGTNRNGWHRWSTKGTITSYEPGRSIAWDVTLVVPVARWAYRIEGDQAASSCTLVESFTDHRGRLMKVVGGIGRGVRDVEAHNRQGMEQTLARIKAAAE